MTRFIDRLLVSPGQSQEISQVMRQSVVILGDNVSDYYWMGNPQEYWTMAKDFPNVAPPFERFFIDFRAPAAIISEVNGQLPWAEAKAREWGVFFESTEIPTFAKQMEFPESQQGALALAQWHLTQIAKLIATSKAAPPWYTQQYQMMQREVDLMGRGEWLKAQRLFLERHQVTDTKWLVRAHLYLGYQRETGYVCVPAWLWDFPVTSTGQFVMVGDEYIVGSHPKENYLKEVLSRLAANLGVTRGKAAHMMYEAMIHYFHPALLTISFLHCKNVTLQQMSTPAPKQPRPTSAKSKKRGKPATPRITYHILDIEPMKQVLKTEGHIEQYGLKKALHICRGHFAHYESGKGLFGKYHGTYWIPQHLRGSPEQGIRIKDYRLKNVEQGLPTQEDQ